MAGKVKSEHERISELESGFGDLRANLDTISREIESGGSLAGLLSPAPLLMPYVPVAALPRPLLSGLLSGVLFALTPLPRTLVQGQGNVDCGVEKEVHRFTGNSRVTCVVESTNDCRCPSVTIKLVPAAGGASSDSPPAAKNNTTSLGPIDVLAGDVIKIVCAGSSGKCQYNWQINLAT